MARMRDFAEFFNNGKRKGDKKGGNGRNRSLFLWRKV